MFSLYILCRLRPRIVSQSFSNIHLTAAGHGAPLTVSSFRGGSRKKLRAVRRSFSNQNNKIQSNCPSTCCFSTATQSEDENLIYTGSLGSAVRGVKMFSYSTSGASIFLMPHILLKTGLGVQSFAMQAVFCGFIGFFTFLTPVLLHVITKGYVIRLYHNPDRDTYTAITYSVFLTEKKSVFHQRQVRIPAVSKMFTTFYADNMGLLVNPDLFPIPHDYNHLMGYDKPFIFDTDNIDRPDKS
ncbi:transmembrane protein 70, mitochondrial [Micropterus salmoides]|uniref:transmembrane protein 70, mitochondrial n=1 Tax=Micropterus salmoides TaxID=27706 RepID=UPI0018EB5143|nr:transmembrane protein 70, mitochondrial [Micropterus salmoides]